MYMDPSLTANKPILLCSGLHWTLVISGGVVRVAGRPICAKLVERCIALVSKTEEVKKVEWWEGIFRSSSPIAPAAGRSGAPACGRRRAPRATRCRR